MNVTYLIIIAIVAAAVYHLTMSKFGANVLDYGVFYAHDPKFWPSNIDIEDLGYTSYRYISDIPDYSGTTFDYHYRVIKGDIENESPTLITIQLSMWDREVEAEYLKNRLFKETGIPVRIMTSGLY